MEMYKIFPLTKRNYLEPKKEVTKVRSRRMGFPSEEV